MFYTRYSFTFHAFIHILTGVGQLCWRHGSYLQRIHLLCLISSQHNAGSKVQALTQGWPPAQLLRICHSHTHARTHTRMHAVKSTYTHVHTHTNTPTHLSCSMCCRGRWHGCRSRRWRQEEAEERRLSLFSNWLLVQIPERDPTEPFQCQTRQKPSH